MPKAARLAGRIWSELRRPAGHAALLLALVSGLACGSDRDVVRLEVYSWWQEEPERLAFESVISLHEARHEGVQVINGDRRDAQITRSDVTKRILAGAPPATFQANAGADLLRWTVVDTANDTLASSSRIAGLDRLFERNGLFDALPTQLLDALRVSADSEPFAVPINIHRLNVLYYNVAREQAFRDRHGGRSFLDVGTLCPEQPASAATLDVEIGAGTQARFVLVLLAFENVLPALTSAGFYDDLFRGRAPADWISQVERALGCVQYLARSFVPDHDDRNWADAVEQVADGQADFTVMGDWANGQLEAALSSGAVRAVPFPGTEKIFVFTSDAFPLPIGAPYPKETEELLDTIASTEAQLRFSAEKGSIPARVAGDVALLGPFAERARDFAASDKVLATSGLFPPYYPVDDLGEALAQMIQPVTGPAQIAEPLAIFRDAEPLLRRWQNRLANGPAPVSP